jgi:hypothetical protein
MWFRTVQPKVDTNICLLNAFFAGKISLGHRIRRQGQIQFRGDLGLAPNLGPQILNLSWISTAPFTLAQIFADQIYKVHLQQVPRDDRCTNMESRIECSAAVRLWKKGWQTGRISLSYIAEKLNSMETDFAKIVVSHISTKPRLFDVSNTLPGKCRDLVPPGSRTQQTNPTAPMSPLRFV